MKVIALAGGVGGAKLVHGLAKVLSPEDFSVIVNTGDDFFHFGLKICPDLDTVCYTLAGLTNPATGWGQCEETWTVLDTVTQLGGADWFQLGDKDLATHLVRTAQLEQGKSLSEITHAYCQHWGITHRVYPMSDDPVETIVYTQEHGPLGFQEYFVHYGFRPVVTSFEFRGADRAVPAPGALEQIESADLVIIAPSNPWVSIDPILAIPEYRDSLARKMVIAVSPLVGNQALKGPAAKMFREMGIEPNPSAVAAHYGHLLKGFVIDHKDQLELEKIQRWRIIGLLSNIVMKDVPDRIRLAEEVLEFGESVLDRSHHL
jgi:LPPG:FO 2-phospho-L-lactate transferase